jgi:hypothetical protein
MAIVAFVLGLRFAFGFDFGLFMTPLPVGREECRNEPGLLP